MLKKIRIISAVFFLFAVSLLFLSSAEVVHKFLGWTAKVQLVPAILAANFAVLAGLFLLTLFFGRIYCSAICPLGIFQDGVSRVAGLVKKNRFSWRIPKKPLVILRFAILAIFVFALSANITVITVLLEPYSIFGRMISQLSPPFYEFTIVFWVALLSFAVITISAIISGRGYCNTICPVGTFLAVITKCSFIKSPIDEEKCNSCGICVKNCKAECIDTAGKKIDYLRCVSCCNCMGECPKGAIKLSWCNPFKGRANPAPTENLTNDGISRRGFISATALLALGLFARTKTAPQNFTPLVPSGAGSLQNFSRRCTACQLCVSVCPEKILRPSSRISSFMQPHLAFERGWCRPECVKCSQVCPTGAINRQTIEEKSRTQTGIAVLNSELCLARCNVCARRCPNGAITMVQKSEDNPRRTIPKIDPARCVGCGACEHYCPSRPQSAITVLAFETHTTKESKQ